MSNKYGPSIVHDGLVPCLDAADKNSYPGSGTTWYDLSGNGNNGTLTNGPTFDSGNGGSITLTTSQYIDLGNDSLELSSPEGTISIWVKTSSTSTSQEIFYTKENRDRVIYIYDNGSGHTYNAGAYNGTNGAYSLLDSGVGVTLNWVNITLTYIQDNGSNAVYKIYLNGIEKDSDITSTTTDVGSDNYSQIGGSAFGGSNVDYPSVGEFQGSVASFLNYNRALTPQEIQQNYNATRGRFGL